VEAGSTVGWERWLGPEGRAIGIDHFGHSAPAPLLFEKFGFTTGNVVETAKRVLGS
jgi:transketolase